MTLLGVMRLISDRIALIAACCASGLLAAACASTAPSALSSDLAGTRWAVQSVDGAPVAQGQREAAIEFAAEDRISGGTGCNSFSGVYEADDGQIDVRALGATKIACEGPVMRQEAALLDVLDKAAEYRRERDRLVITAEDGRNIVLAPG